MHLHPIQDSSRYICKAFSAVPQPLGAVSVTKIFQPNVDTSHAPGTQIQRSAERTPCTCSTENVLIPKRDRAVPTRALPTKSRPGQPVYADAASGGVSSCYSRFTRCKRHIHVVPMGEENRGKLNGGRTLEEFCNGFQSGC
jgi:hypothetical protein